MLGTPVCNRVVKTNNGINQNHKIGPQAYMLRILNIVFGEMSACSRGQMTTCGKSHNANPMLLNSPFLCPGANNQYSLLGILQRSVFLIYHSDIVGYPVFQYKCSDA